MGLLQNRSVVITGAASGVGRASALRFVAEGARVVCADVRKDWLDVTVTSIAAAGGTAVGVRCDVTDSDEVDAAVAAAVEHFGRLDVMFNNAGISSPRRGMLLEDHTTEDFDRLVAVNGRGVFNGCRAAVTQFKAQGDGGVIVNTASLAGMISWGSVVYGATKGMVIQLTRALASEVAPHGIRVNSISPGGMVTNFGIAPGESPPELTPEVVERLKTLHPLGRVITPEDCADGALFLASDLAANVTGTNLPIEGGYLTR